MKTLIAGIFLLITAAVIYFTAVYENTKNRCIEYTESGITKTMSVQKHKQILMDNNIFCRYIDALESQNTTGIIQPMWLVVLEWDYTVYDAEQARYANGDMCETLEKDYKAWMKIKQ